MKKIIGLISPWLIVIVSVLVTLYIFYSSDFIVNGVKDTMNENVLNPYILLGAGIFFILVGGVLFLLAWIVNLPKDDASFSVVQMLVHTFGSRDSSTPKSFFFPTVIRIIGSVFLATEFFS